MHSSVQLFLVLVIALDAVSARTVSNAVSRDETDEEAERIIGGRTASEGQFPWAAALFYNDQFICTSSVISPTTVMTAAHCVVFNGVTEPAGRFYAIANLAKSAPEVRIDFDQVIPHPEYDDQSITNDIAIFKTTQRIDLTDGRVKSICLARPDTDMDEYSNATAMGWGRTFRILPFSIPDKLQYVEQDIVNNRECSLTYLGLEDSKLCAKKLGRGVCNGDSGGPLVHLSADKEPVEIGIASYIRGFIVGCGTIFPAVFTRVSSFTDFIDSNANDNEICYL